MIRRYLCVELSAMCLSNGGGAAVEGSVGSPTKLNFNNLLTPPSQFKAISLHLHETALMARGLVISIWLPGYSAISMTCFLSAICCYIRGYWLYHSLCAFQNT